VEARQLPEPDYIIGSTGTELYAALYNFENDFRKRLGEAWDLELVQKIVSSVPGVLHEPSEGLLSFKSSWTWLRARSDEIEKLKRRLNHGSNRAHVDYSCGYFLDVVPASAGKGRALAWLCARLNILLRDVLVAGDSGDDTSMFLLPGVKGITPGNALPELLDRLAKDSTFIAPSSLADGVLEGLQHFSVTLGSSQRIRMLDDPRAGIKTGRD
jgi:sucrose-6F-phosphate phosphohydrolase